MADYKEAKLTAGDRVARHGPGGSPMRTGTVLEVVLGRGELHGYRIRWDDGHIGLFSPSARGLERIEPASTATAA